MEEFLVKYADVFALDASELGTTNLAEHRIDTGDHSLIQQPARRIPFALKDQVDELVREMHSQDVIVLSASPRASPVVLVRKKRWRNESLRILSQIEQCNEFPLPRIDDILDLLSGAKYFTTLDLASGYWQVPMEHSSQEKAAFTTHCGLYEFKKMPFRLLPPRSRD